MPAKVVDASALAAVLFGEPDAERVVDELRDCSVVAPPLLGFEVASVCLKKLQRLPSRRADLLTAFTMLAQMGIAETAVEPREALLLAERERLTVYDAAYLRLAERLGADLVTLDARLAAAARRALR